MSVKQGYLMHLTEYGTMLLIFGNITYVLMPILIYYADQAICFMHVRRGINIDPQTRC